jgi:hypothetical protein
MDQSTIIIAILIASPGILLLCITIVCLIVDWLNWLCKKCKRKNLVQDPMTIQMDHMEDPMTDQKIEIKIIDTNQ